MQKLDFYQYNPEEETEGLLFSLTLNSGKIASSNRAGEIYLSNLSELYRGGIRTKDVQLYVEKKYEELFNLLERTCRHPDFYVK